MDEGLPVRVIRGMGHDSTFSPKSGYTYAGIYSVVDAWEDRSKGGKYIRSVALDWNTSARTRPVQLLNRMRWIIRQGGPNVKWVLC